MSLFPQNKSNSEQPTILYGYPVQTSVFGKPLSMVYGTNRVAGSVIGVYNWQAHQVKSGGKGGGKSSGGGKFGGGQNGQQYTYTAAVQIAVCQGPIEGMMKIWQDKTRYAVAVSTEKYVITGSRVFTASQNSHFLFSVGVIREDAYSTSVNDYGSPGSTTYAGTQNTKLTEVGSSPATGQFTRSAGVYTFAAGDNGKTVYVTYSWVIPTSSGTGNPLTDLDFSLFLGTRGQTPWTYLTDNFPDQAIGYTLTAYLANDNMDLGQSGMIPNYSYEVIGFNRFSGPGALDALPSDIVTDYLTNEDHGVPGWSSSDLGSMTQFQNWCLANGIFVSPVMDAQTSASAHLNDLMTVTNCAPVYSDGVLKIIPYGDKTLVGNGATFTPDTSPEYDLSYDDFIAESGSSPVTVDRPSVWDAFNSVSVEWSNRYNDYNREPCEESSLYHVRKYGLRKQSPISMPMVTTLKVAQFVAASALQRLLFIRLRYRFRLPITYDLLEPMDLVTLTDPNQGLNLTPVRIVSIDEDDKGNLEVEAEAFPWGTATATLHSKPTGSSYTPGYYAEPGSVNAPMFFEPVPKLVQDNRYHMYAALSGGPEWGGCNVYISADGTNYDLLGTQKGPATVGVLTAGLAVGAKHDTVHTLSVNLLNSFGSLSSYTSTQASQGMYLLQVGSELIGFETATLTGAFTYDITGLYRGMLGTQIAAHSTSDKITFVDTKLFDWIFDAADIGNVRHFKFQSFNRFGQRPELLSDVTDYTYTPLGRSGVKLITNADTKLDSFSQTVRVIATSADVNIYLPEEDISAGDDITVIADESNTFLVKVWPLTIALGGDADDTIDGAGTSVDLAAGEVWEGVAQ